MPELLNELAVNILLVEPGDLSVVGELVVLVEELLAREELEAQPALKKMLQVFQAVVEKVIMGELSDAASSYDQLGQCIGVMQEEERKGGKGGEARVHQFCEQMQAIGHPVSEAEFLAAGQEKETAAAAGQAEAIPAEAGPAEAAAPATEEPPPKSDILQDKDLLKGFVEESFEHLETIEANILELEQNPDDAEIINNIFRPFHTIKGVSGFLNLKNINKLAHATENLLDDVRNGRRAMDTDVIEIVLNVGDYLRAMVDNVREALEKGSQFYREFEIADHVARINALVAGAPATTAPAAPAVPPAAEEQAPAAAPAIEAGTDEEMPVVEAGEEAAIPAAPSPPAPPASAARPAAETPMEAAPSAAGKTKIGDSIKVDIEKLDSLVNAMGELVIMQSLIQQNPLVASINDPKLARDFSQLSRIITDLQQTAMSMRMVPIRQTFQKMVRLVRDLSKKTGKDVNLVMSGEETEIDRNMVDSIYDPLVHMMRNSVDHGVQTPEERQKNGKPPQGTVHLRAYQKGSNIVIEIEDDGEGLNPEKLKRKARERGLIAENEVLTDHEAINLIMMPGFSTAEKITDVSGRGVGMDVVKKAVEKLRGKVEISSQLGKGCIFTIRLPLTLAIIEGIVVRVGQERYIIPTVSVQESIRPLPENYNTVHGKGETLMVRGELVPLIRLYEVFKEKPTNTDPCAAIVVVVEYEGQCRALMVDELLGKQEVVIKSLGGYLKNIKGVAGGTILGDGKVGLILDLAGMIAYADQMSRVTTMHNKSNGNREVTR